MHHELERTLEEIKNDGLAGKEWIPSPAFIIRSFRIIRFIATGKL